MKAVVGFDRRIKLEWLDALADQVAKGSDPVKLRAFLDRRLKADHPCDIARAKTRTVLMRIWALVPDQDGSLRKDAFELLKSIPAQDRIWLHWGMCLVAYPLFRDTASAVGRLLKLQGEFTSSQLQRKLITQWGERSTVIRALQRIVRSMVEWNALADADARGHFRAATRIATRSRTLQLWLVRAGLQACQTEAVEAEQLLSQPFFFAFKLSVRPVDLRRSTDFSIHRQGVHVDMVSRPLVNEHFRRQRTLIDID